MDLFAIVIIVVAFLLRRGMLQLVIHKYLDHILIEWTKGNVTLSKMRKLLYRFPPKYWITSKAEKDFYNSLPDNVPLYRGGSILEQSSAYGVSWTTKLSTAEWHAYKDGKQDQCVYRVIVPKSAIRAIPIPDTLVEIMILDPKGVEVANTEPTEAFYEYQRDLVECRQKTRQAIEDLMRLLKF